MNVLKWVLGGGAALITAIMALLRQLAVRKAERAQQAQARAEAQLETAQGAMADLRRANEQLQAATAAIHEQQEATRDTIKQMDERQEEADAAVADTANANLSDLLDFMRND